MAERHLFAELSSLLKRAKVEIRVERFQTPPDSAGGLCRMKGKHLVLLHSGASKDERAQALLEVLERLGLSPLGLRDKDLSPTLRERLKRRGQISSLQPTGPNPEPNESSDSSRPPRLRLLPPLTHLSYFTTMGLGGAAENWVEGDNEPKIQEAARQSRQSGQPLFILGGGSNLVVSDNGVAGTVLQMRLRGIEIERCSDHVLVSARAGENWHDFASLMTENEFGGVECLGGIPGTVGATPIQNVGAYGQDVSQTIVSVETLDRQSLKKKHFTNEECGFSYRQSFFKNAGKDRFIVLGVTFKLSTDRQPQVRYGELARSFEEAPSPPNLMEVFERVVALRKAKSMVLDPWDVNGRSCGSFFENALVPAQIVDQIEKNVGEAPPTFAGKGELLKIPSAWLIERAGLNKGFTSGKVGLSSKHTLSIVAHDGAKSDDIVVFAHHIRQVVLDKFGVLLHPEPHFWGFAQLDEGLPVLG